MAILMAAAGHRWWLAALSSYIGYSMGAFIFTMLRATRPSAWGKAGRGTIALWGRGVLCAPPALSECKRGAVCARSKAAADHSALDPV